MYILEVEKRTAKLYYIWEYGLKNGIVRWQSAKHHFKNDVYSKICICKTKREADQWGRRVIMAAAYLDGKLGKGLRGHPYHVNKFP
tara:strand:- start:1538 stop:1795 length:258 start_codon:yes stop_codon:yes gene_type:complete